MYKVLDIVSPTEDQVREWGFDEDLLLTDQDEDLILYANQYVTVLWELACDPECPKNEYCLSILSNYSKSLFLTNNSKSIRKIASAIEDKQNNLSAPCLDWVRDFNRCNVLLSHPQTIDVSEADPGWLGPANLVALVLTALLLGWMLRTETLEAAR